jgi:hypothetical protein
MERSKPLYELLILCIFSYLAGMKLEWSLSINHPEFYFGKVTHFNAASAA